jgi:ribosomal-protein-alanine N-acetyltransferase
MGTEKESKPNFFSIHSKKKDYIIRRCTTDDLEGVIEVNERELPEDYPYFFYKSILDNYSDSFLIACERDNLEKIIGYVMWRIERTPSINSLKLVNKGHLVSIAVSKGWRRKGIATALLKKSMPEIKKQDISEFVLEVRVSNYPAINLYKRLGFKIQTIKKAYYRDGENAYYMVRKTKS